MPPVPAVVPMSGGRGIERHQVPEGEQESEPLLHVDEAILLIFVVPLALGVWLHPVGQAELWLWHHVGVWLRGVR